MIIGITIFSDVIILKNFQTSIRQTPQTFIFRIKLIVDDNLLA